MSNTDKDRLTEQARAVETCQGYVKALADQYGKDDQPVPALVLTTAATFLAHYADVLRETAKYVDQIPTFPPTTTISDTSAGYYGQYL